MQIAKSRLYLNAAATALVEQGDKAAATLYCSPGDTIPDSAANRFGLVDGELKKAKAASGQKEGKPGSDKEKKGGSDKSQKAGGTKTVPPKPPALTDIAGIGPATAKVLAGVGVTSVALLADIDPAKVPAVDGLPPAFEWEAVIDAAKSLASNAASTANAE